MSIVRTVVCDTNQNNISEAKNHLGERTQTTFAGWKAACKRANPDVWFDGDKDICNAMVGPKPYVRGETKSVGEWDGASGSIYKTEAISFKDWLGHYEVIK